MSALNSNEVNAAMKYSFFLYSEKKKSNFINK